MKKNQIIKKITALTMATVMLLGSAPLAGLAGLNLSWLFSTVVKAADTVPEEFTEGAYKYTVSNNEATITGRTNLFYDVTVPATLGGYTVTAIGDNALKTAGAISSVTIPASVKTIGKQAFYSCGELTSVIFEDNSMLTSIGTEAFTGCGALTNVDFGQNSMLKEIGISAFVNCKALQNITLPDNVEKIGDSAFEGCSALETINIPVNVSEIGGSVLAKCSALEAVTVSEGNQNYAADENGILYNKEETELIVYPMGKKQTEFVIPMNVTRVETSAFSGQKYLEKLSWENGELTMGISAFANCEKLVSVNIPEGLKYLTDWAFTSCLNLKEVNLPESLEGMGSGAFHDCKSLESIKLPSHLKTISNNCFNLCVSLKEITIPDSVTDIYSHAFWGCRSLETIIIGKGLETIGTDIFAQTKSLKEIIVSEENPHCLSENGAFYDQYKEVLVQYACAREDKVFIVPDTVKIILSRAFNGNKNLEAVVIPSSVAQIEQDAFKSLGNADYTSKITDIYYGGSEIDWAAIEGVDSAFDNLADIKIHYNFIPVIEEKKPTSNKDGERKMFCSCCQNLVTTEVLPATGPLVVTDERTDVTAFYDDDCFNEDVLLSVENIVKRNEDGSVYFSYSYYAENGREVYKQVGLYNIKMLNDKSDVVQPNEGKYVTLKIPIPKDYSDVTEFMVVHWRSHGGMEFIEADEKEKLWVKEGYIYFKTSSFSEFEICAKTNLGLKKLPDSTVCNYRGKVNLNGIELMFADDNANIQTVTDTSEMRVDGLDSTKLGKQIVKVYYGDDYVELEVTVEYAWWQWIIRILLLGFLWY